MRRGASGARRTAVVSGAAGFIGHRLVRVLLGYGFRVRALDDLSAGRVDRLPRHPRLAFRRADARDERAWREVLRGVGSSDVVVHLAAVVGVARVLRDPIRCYRDNVDGCGALARVLATRPRSDRPLILFASSSEVYVPSERPLAESSPLRSTDGRGRFAYAASKLVGERMFGDVGGERAVAARFFNVVGPGQDATSGMMLASFVEAVRLGRPVDVYGDGTQLRTWAHVDDVAETLGWLVQNRGVSGPLNVGGRARARVIDVVAMLARVSGGHLSVRYVDPRTNMGPDFVDIPHREPDLARLKRLGCPVPSASLEHIVADAWARHPVLASPGRDAVSTAASPSCPEPSCAER